MGGECANVVTAKDYRVRRLEEENRLLHAVGFQSSRLPLLPTHIYLPFPSIVHLSPPPFYLLSFHSKPTYLTFKLSLSLSFWFPSPSLSPSASSSSSRSFSSSLVYVPLFLSLFLASPTTLLSYKHVHTYIHVASGYGMLKHKAVLTTKRDLALDASVIIWHLVR